MAQSNLGSMYFDGQGVKQDYIEAVQWYRKAAEQGYSSAQFNIGVAYMKGLGVPQDYMQAHIWFNLAAIRDSHARSVRELLASAMTPAQLAEAQRLAAEWKPKHQ